MVTAGGICLVLSYIVLSYLILSCLALEGDFAAGDLSPILYYIVKHRLPFGLVVLF